MLKGNDDNNIYWINYYKNNKINLGDVPKSILEKNIKSCLFATRTFLGGIDVNGKSLCNVIITRLTFSNVDAITENKAAQFSKKRKPLGWYI